MSWLRPLLMGRAATRHFVSRCGNLPQSTAGPRGPGLLRAALDARIDSAGGGAPPRSRWTFNRGLTTAAEGEPATVEQAIRWHSDATKAAKAGELREASVLYEKALRARIELLGEFDPETDRTRHSLAATLEEEIFHLSSANFSSKTALQNKLSWVIRAGLEDLDDPDYMVGGESDPVDPNDPLGLAGIDLEAMAAAGREGGGGGFGSNIDVDFSNIDPEAMASANQIMDQLRQQGWKPPEEREPGETGPWDVADAEVTDLPSGGVVSKLKAPPPPGELDPKG